MLANGHISSPIKAAVSAFLFLAVVFAGCDLGLQTNPEEPDYYGTISGYVCNSLTCEPICGAVVELEDGPRATTDETGYYAIGQVMVGEREARVKACGYLACSRSIAVTYYGTNSFRFSLLPLDSASFAVVIGVVVDSTSRAGVAEATVSSDDAQTTTADGQGRYLLRVSPGRRSLSASMTGYEASSITVEVAAGDTISAAIGILLLDDSNSALLAGRVTDQVSGSGIEGARVATDDIHFTRTGADGGYSFRVAPGRLRATVEAAEYLPDARDLNLSAGNSCTVNFILTPSVGTLSGTVTDRNSGLGIAGTCLTSDVGQATVSDTEGEYTFRVATGYRTVSAKKSGYAVDTARIEILPGVALNRDFRLAPLDDSNSATVSGTVCDRGTGNGIPGATVSCTSGDTLLADSTGRFELRVVPGTYELTAETEGYAPQTAALRAIQRGIEYPVLLRLRPTADTGILYGLVTDSNTDGRLRGAVILSDDGQRTTSNDRGYYSFRVGDGYRRVTCSLEGYSSCSGGIHIAGQETHSLDIALTPEGGGG